MTVLASYANQTNFESPEITVAMEGEIRLWVYGAIQPGFVSLRRKGIDGKFHDFAELRFERNAALGLAVENGDTFKVIFHRCTDASAELTQA